MSFMQKYILWQIKLSSVARSIIAYKHYHTIKTEGYESEEDAPKSRSYFHRHSDTSHKTSNYNRPYRYPKNNQWNNQTNFRRNSYDFKLNDRVSQNIERTPLHNEKFFYAEHPDVTQRSEEEVENYRKSMSISVSGKNIPKPIMKFTELCLPEPLRKCLEEENFSEPSAIQSQGWPIALSGRDMIGVSQTGSGKTLAYMLPAIVHALNQENVDTRKCMPRILVLGPTRELIQQIYQVSKKYLDACGLIGSTVYGGASKFVQLASLRGAEVCVGTPGRLIDFLSGNQVSLENCSFLVLDEADRMLDMGFEPQIRDIISQIRPGRQTLMWSATWPTEIRDLAKEFLTDYIHVTVGSGDLVANPNIRQNIIITTEQKKEEELYSLLEKIFSNSENKVLVFAQTKRQVDLLTRILSKDGFRVMGLHGDITQAGRDRVLSSFRRNKSCILIATDVAARGLDITDIQHVINYDFPPNIEDYIHRIGRTARGVACGESHSFFTSENAGVAKKLITVLKQSNQEINPELHTIAAENYMNKKFNSRPFYRQRLYRNA